MKSRKNTKATRSRLSRLPSEPGLAPRRRGPVRQALLVLGMHRSGTSALTRVFSLLGADLPKNLMPASSSNEAGHWESNDLWHIHDELLSTAGSRWDDWRAFNPEWKASNVGETYKQKLLDLLRRDFDASPFFVIKDPRICRLLPIWVEVLDRFGAAPHFVIPIRDPVEVAASLRARDGLLPAKSYLLWLRHVLDAERATRGFSRAVVSYDLLIDDWRRLVANVTARAKLHWPRRSDHSDLEIDRFLSTSLRHQRADPAQLGARADIIGWVKEAYQALRQMADGRDNKENSRSARSDSRRV